MVKAFLGIKGDDVPSGAHEPILPGFMTQPDFEE
jgi:hypothetical protein